MREQAGKHRKVMRCSDLVRKPREIRRNDVSPSNGANSTWQSGGKARFIYMPPGLTKYALAKFLLIDLELLTGNAEDNKAQATERCAA